MMHILLIEDSTPMASFLNQYLGMYKGSIAITYEIVGTMTKAIARLKNEGSVDVNVLDLNLPDSSGIFSITNLSAEAPTVPIVVLTGDEKEDTEDKCLKAGAVGFMRKSDIYNGVKKVDAFVSELWYAVLKWEQVHAVAREYGPLKQCIDEVKKSCEEAKK